MAQCSPGSGGWRQILLNTFCRSEREISETLTSLKIYFIIHRLQIIEWATKWTFSHKKRTIENMTKCIQKPQRLNYGSASEHVDYYPIFLWGVCRGAGKEKESAIEITSKAAILLPRSLLKELIKNRGVPYMHSGPLKLQGLLLTLSTRWPCRFISAPMPIWKSPMQRQVSRK